MVPPDEQKSRASGPDATPAGTASSSTTEQLLRSAKAGDRESLGHLVAQCRGYLLAIAHAELDETLRGKLAVSDVVQETLLRVQQNLGGFRGENEQELLAWIRQILVHYVADVRRAFRQSGKRQISREFTLTTGESSSEPHLAELLLDTATPGRAAEAGEALQRLQIALATLTEEHRIVLTLRTWDRLPFAEVGERMGRSADAARMLWARAVQQLAQAWRRNADESP